MFKGKRVLGVITARSGSKRLKDKNLKLLRDRPLLTWTIEAALKSKHIDEVIVSTDSKVIAKVANDFGAYVPFLRPKELSDDQARSIDAVRHAIEWLKQEEKKYFDYVVLLQPTSPFREASHIDAAFERLANKDANAIISVCEVEHNSLWSNTLKEEKSLEGFLKPELINSRSQDLETYYRLNGAIYICDVKRLLEEDTFFIKNNIYAYEMSQMDSVDIDTELDFLIAQTILKQKEDAYAT